jgi:hypothetical protein
MWRLRAGDTVKVTWSSSAAAAGRQARLLRLRWQMPLTRATLRAAGISLAPTRPARSRPLGDDERAWREFLRATYGKLD